MKQRLKRLKKMVRKPVKRFSRLFSFLCVGGLGALVNLLCFTAVYDALASPLGTQLAYLSSFLLATEVSILVNFVLNDRFTFHNLHNFQRSWPIRCLRFHVTSIAGVAVVLVISFSLLHFLHMRALFAQGIALLVATGFNFAGHHFFTYRRIDKRRTDEVADYYPHL